MAKQPNLKLVHSAEQTPARPAVAAQEAIADPAFLQRVIDEGVIHGDAQALLPQLPRESVDLFFTSPPYADARAYSRIHPDRYVEWFLPFARAMYDTAKPTGSLIINIKNRVANRANHHISQ